jgi:hypothetical protein
MHRNATLAQGLLKRLGDQLILGRHDPWCHLQQRHLGAQGREDRGQLAAGGGRPDDRQRRWQFTQPPDIAVSQGVFGTGERRPARVPA